MIHDKIIYPSLSTCRFGFSVERQINCLAASAASESTDRCIDSIVLRYLSSVHWVSLLSSDSFDILETTFHSAPPHLVPQARLA